MSLRLLCAQRLLFWHGPLCGVTRELQEKLPAAGRRQAQRTWQAGGGYTSSNGAFMHLYVVLNTLIIIIFSS